jgi:glycosyltransferase involved in cell wall biosynthesis
MKILQVCSADVLGGGEVHVIELTAKLREFGHDVSVAGRPGGPLEIDYGLRFLNAMDLVTAYRLRRIVTAHGFDIVHAHLARDYPVAAAALAGLGKPRLVLTRQLIFPVSRNPLYRRVDGWIVTTGQIRDSILRHDPAAVEVIPNWVDVRTLPLGTDRPGPPSILGLLGQVSPHKGHDDAIEMMRRLGPGFRLLVAGRGEPGYEQRLRSRAEGLPVEFVGFVDSRKFLPRIDVLILPSWEEPFGIVVLEAMAAGVNVVATDRGGPPEILDHGQAGLLVGPRDPEAMANAILKLAADAGLRATLRREARKRVESRYDIHLTVPRIEAFYRRLLGSSGKNL